MIKDSAQPSLIALYDPNIRWSKHTFEITYMQWDYKKVVTVDVGGNCRGARLFETAIRTHFDELFEAQGEMPILILERGEEDTLECSFEDEDDLMNYCVSVRIIGFIESKK